MNIKGRGTQALDLDLLGQLALKQQSGNTISKTEAQSILSSIQTELKDEFSHSTRGLANASRAIENTLQLALDSGWVKTEAASTLIESFLDGKGEKNLDALVKEVRAEVRPARTSYSSYSYPRPTRINSGT